MRLDKYLKLTRLIKRRAVAKELLDRGIFTLNDRVAKPSTEVNIGDVLVLPLGRHKLTVEVTNIKDYVKKEEAESLYTITKDELINDSRD